MSTKPKTRKSVDGTPAGVVAKKRSIPKERLCVEEKRQRAAANRAALAEFHAQHGEGYNDLENFIYELDTFDADYDDPELVRDLLHHVSKVAAAISSYLEHEHRTLDEAFRVRRPDGYRRAAARKKHLHMRQLQQDGEHLRKRGAVVDSAFFEFLANRHKVDKTKAAEWYYLKHRGLRPDSSKDSSDLSELVRSQLNWKK